MNLSRFARLTRVSNAAAAGQTTVNSSSVDMAGFDAVTFVVAFGAITTGGVQSIKAQQSSDNGSSDGWSDLEGTGIAVADDDDNQCVVLEIDNPQKRYVRVVVSRATQDSVVDGAFAFQTKGKVEPVTHDASTVVGSEYHLAPAEGTA